MEQPLDNSEVIDQIALRLADVFVKEIYQFYNHRSYSTYKKSLSEILHWAHEFSIEHQHKLVDWEAFEESENNIYKATDRDEFLISWGKERMALFLRQNKTKDLLLRGLYQRMYEWKTAPGLYVSI